MRTTVIDNLAHAIALQLLNERDVAQMHNAKGINAADDIGQNPVAAFAELTASISNFAAVLTGPSMKAAATALDSLAHAINGLTAATNSYFKGITKEQEAQAKGAPSPAIEETNRRINKLVFGEDTDESGLDRLKRWWHSGDRPYGPQLPGRCNYLGRCNCLALRPASPVGTTVLPWAPTVMGPGRDPRSPQNGPYSYTRRSNRSR